MGGKTGLTLSTKDDFVLYMVKNAHLVIFTAFAIRDHLFTLLLILCLQTDHFQFQHKLLAELPKLDRIFASWHWETRHRPWQIAFTSAPVHAHAITA
jgi:hypothetical protein